MRHTVAFIALVTLAGCTSSTQPTRPTPLALGSTEGPSLTRLAPRYDTGNSCPTSIPRFTVGEHDFTVSLDAVVLVGARVYRWEVYRQNNDGTYPLTPAFLPSSNTTHVEWRPGGGRYRVRAWQTNVCNQDSPKGEFQEFTVDTSDSTPAPRVEEPPPCLDLWEATTFQGCEPPPCYGDYGPQSYEHDECVSGRTDE